MNELKEKDVEILHVLEDKVESDESLEAEKKRKVADVDAQLQLRIEKLDAASDKMLDIMQRIEKKVGADLPTLQIVQSIKDLEERIRDRISDEDRIAKRTAEFLRVGAKELDDPKG